MKKKEPKKKFKTLKIEKKTIIKDITNSDNYYTPKKRKK